MLTADRATRAKVEPACKAAGIVLAAPAKTKDPCDINPLKCRKP